MWLHTRFVCIICGKCRIVSIIQDKYTDIVCCGSDEYYMSSVRQVDTLLTAATQSILLQITWSEAFKVCSANFASWAFCGCLACLIDWLLVRLIAWFWNFLWGRAKAIVYKVKCADLVRTRSNILLSLIIRNGTAQPNPRWLQIDRDVVSGLATYQHLVSAKNNNVLVSAGWRLVSVSANYGFCHKLFPVIRCLGYAGRPWSRLHIIVYKLTLCIIIIISDVKRCSNFWTSL